VVIGAAASTQPADWATQQSFPIAQYSYAAITCADQTHCLAVGRQITSGAGAVVTTSDGGAHWSPQSVPGGTGALSGVACASASDCWAVGSDPSFVDGMVLSTTDGGQTWSTRGVPSGTGPLSSISCPSGSACVAVGANFPDFVGGTGSTGNSGTGSTGNSGTGSTGNSGTGMTGGTGPGAFFLSGTGVALSTTDGGSTWSSATLPSATGPLQGVSCASSADCWAVGSDPTATTGLVLSTTDGGRHWGGQALPAAVGPLSAVACTSTSDCRVAGTTPIAGNGVLVGMIVGTTDGGSTWTGGNLPNGTGPLTSLLCTSNNQCWAGGSGFTGGDGVVVATTDGSAWVPQALPPGTGPLAGLTCASTSHCWSVGGNPFVGFPLTGASVRAARSGHAARVSAAAISGSPRPSSTIGFAYGSAGMIVATTDGGTTWTTQTVSSSGLTSLSAMSCPDAVHCWALATDSTGAPVVLATTDGWKTASTESLPSGIDLPSDITCATTSDCWVVGAQVDITQTSVSESGVVLATTDGGTTWTPQSLPIGTGLLAGVACASSSDCWAAGYDLFSQVGTVVATTDGGATWSAQTLPNGTGVLAGVACASSSDCWAVGSQPFGSAGEVVATTDGGAAWALQSVPRDSGPLSAVSCPSATTCWAIGSPYNGSGVLATTDGGTTWATQLLPFGVGGLSDISCPTTSDCWAVAGSVNYFPGVFVPPIAFGGSGVIVATTDGGSLWSVQGVPTDVVAVSGVSCPSATACWAVGETQTDFSVLTELGVTVTPTTTLPPPVTVPTNGATPYELYCPGTPVGNIVLNDVVTTAQVSPADPSAGQQFTVVDYQTQVPLPSSISSAAAALGNSDIAGTALSTVDVTGATPSSISSGPMSFDVPLPSPVPSTGLLLVIPPTAGTVGPFTASGGPITVTQDKKAQLTLNVAGSSLNLTCSAYPNNSEPTGITSRAPSGSPQAPTIATASGPGTTTTVAPPTTLGPTTTVTSTTTEGSTTTLATTTTTTDATTTTDSSTTTTDATTTTDSSTTTAPTAAAAASTSTTAGASATVGSTQAVAGSTTTAAAATAAKSGATSDPSSGVVSAGSGSLAFTGPGAGVVWIGVLGVVLMLLGMALLGLTDAPRHAVRRLAMARAAWSGRADVAPPAPGEPSSHPGGLGNLPAAVERGGRILSTEVAHAVRWLLGR